MSKPDVKNVYSAELKQNRDPCHWVPAHSKTKQIHPSAGSLVDHIKPVSRNCGIWFNSNLGFEQHTTKLVQSCFHHLRNISKIRSILHTLISSRLDYSNSLFTCLNQKSIDQLQTVWNSAARLLTRTKRHDHIIPALASLDWLPLCFRIYFTDYF